MESPRNSSSASSTSLLMACAAAAARTSFPCRFVRMARLPGGAAPALLALAPRLGMALAHSHADLSLRAYDVNLRPLTDALTLERLTSLAPSSDGRLVLSAGAGGAVTLRWLHSLEVVLRYEAARGPITALAVTAEDCIVAGCGDGALVLFAPDPRRSITRRYNLADARAGPARPAQQQQQQRSSEAEPPPPATAGPPEGQQLLEEAGAAAESEAGPAAPAAQAEEPQAQPDDGAPA